MWLLPWLPVAAAYYRPVVTPVTTAGRRAAAGVCGGGFSSFAHHARHRHHHRLLRRYGAGRGAYRSRPIASSSVSESGSSGYTLNSDGTLTNFPVTQHCRPNRLRIPRFSSSRLRPPHPPVNLFTPGTGMWTADRGTGTMRTFSARSTGVAGFRCSPFRWRRLRSLVGGPARLVRPAQLRHQPGHHCIPAAWPATSRPSTGSGQRRGGRNRTPPAYARFRPSQIPVGANSARSTPCRASITNGSSCSTGAATPSR